jgi:1-carboxybiuret hydrolase subunit AtzG-like protein
MMTDAELEAWLVASARLLDITVAPEWRDAVLLHLRITCDMAQRIMDFPLADEAEPAPVFRA